MAKTKKGSRNTSDVAGLLTDLLITQLALAGVQQQTIRQILGCDVNRVSRITKHVKAARKETSSREQRANR